MVETDITGYGRKMGRDANGIDGRVDDVVVLQGERMIKGTVPYRTLVPANSESAGGGANAGDFAPTEGRADGAIGNPRL